ncbi:MAG: filamentous hemagglutinin N-terminal domain-containing protein [Verrucomicrobiae bacterium]|nr:filamentous hemagglutinin N-terminal domain-containing protein [Verrucomicrobiae bacterium]
MKRLLPPLFVVAYAISGIGLLLQPSPPQPVVHGGTVRWNPFTEKMVIRISSSHAIINLDEIDLGRTEFVCDDPDATIIVRVTGGNPTHLMGVLPSNNVMLVNPAGVIVGPESVVTPGSTFGASMMDLGDVLDWKKEPIFPNPTDDPPSWKVARDSAPSESTVEFKAHGNVYALAIKKEGKVIRANRPKSANGRVILTAPKYSEEDK